MKDEDKQSATANSSSLIFWAVLTIFSIILLLEIGDSNTAQIWLLVIAVVVSVVLLFKLKNFQSKTHDLLEKGQSLEPYSYSKQNRRIVYIFLLTILVFVLPLLLSGYLGFTIWLGSLLGAIDGWILQLLGYNVYLRNWQKRHNGKLYVVQVWNGAKVEYSGLSLERRN